jgi:hypothetical protein
VEIEKPLKPDDIGTWRILYDFDQHDNGNLGCVFEVGGNTMKTAEEDSDTLFLKHKKLD